VGVLQTMSGTAIRYSVGDDSRRDPLRSAAPELAISTGGNLDFSSLRVSGRTWPMTADD
jgi:hypothetical protein